MKLNLKDFMKLDVKGLLAVNGGYNCSSTTTHVNTIPAKTCASGTEGISAPYCDFICKYTGPQYGKTTEETTESTLPSHRIGICGFMDANSIKNHELIPA